MKRMILKYSLLIALCVISGINLQGAVSSHSQKIVKKYKVNRETTVYINNKYGKVHITNSNKDSIEFEINLVIKSTNYTRMLKIKDNINFDFVQTKYNITATTIFGSPYNSIFSDLKNLAESFVTPENQVTIDYYINAPVWLNFKIDNKYGDIYIDDTEGELSVTLSNGGMKANKIFGKSNLNLSSGCSDIHFIKDALININYANLNVKSAERIDIISKSCNIYLDDIDYLKIDSKRDKYFVSSVDKTYGDSYFSDIRITDLQDEISYDMKYGNINLEKLSKNFSLINLASEYTDISIIFDRNMTYNFDMTHFNEISFYYPKELSKLQEKLVNQETKEFLVYGTIGPSNVGNAKVNIKAYKKCYIRIEHK